MNDAPPPVSRSPAVVVMSLKEALGDAMLTLPAYRALRLAFPNHRIIGVYNEDSVLRTTLKRLGDELIDEFRVEQRFARSWRVARSALMAIEGPIDLVLDLRMNDRVKGTFLASIGLSPRYLAPAPGYVFRRGVRVGLQIRPGPVHDRRHRLIEIVAGRALPFDAALDVLPAARPHAASLLPLGSRYVGIAPGAVGTHKHWPKERHEALALMLLAEKIVPVFLLGPLETELRASLARIAGVVIIDEGAANGDLGYLPWLMHAAAERMAACVAAESGIGHLVGSHGGPLLTLADIDKTRRWKPTTRRWWALRSQDFGSSDMAAIPAEAVLRVVHEMIAWRA